MQCRLVKPRTSLRDENFKIKSVRLSSDLRVYWLEYSEKKPVNGGNSLPRFFGEAISKVRDYRVKMNRLPHFVRSDEKLN